MEPTKNSTTSRLVFSGHCEGADLKGLFNGTPVACPCCGHRMGVVSVPCDDTEAINVWSQSGHLQTLTHGHTTLWCDACGETSEARDWGIDMWLFEPQVSIEDAAEAAAQARLAWFKAQRELLAADKNAYRITWGEVESEARRMGVTIEKGYKEMVAHSLRTQIDKYRMIRVALADAYEQAQEVK